jgi:xanthine dehydrogenase small subunit
VAAGRVSAARSERSERPDDAVAVRLVRRGRIVTVDDVPPDLTVLDWLREVRGEPGTKEGCREGDCGACTVVIGEPATGGGIRYRPVDSCLTLLRSIDGCALWTVADLAGPDGTLHPVQQAVVDHHASQCGFCTPGVVMSLYALYQQHLPPADETGLSPLSRADAVSALAGNLCRCTGYRSIVTAAMALADYPVVPDDPAAGLDLLARIRPSRSLAEVLGARRDRPAATVVAGGTDVLVARGQGDVDLTDVIALRGVPELRAIRRERSSVLIGAAVPLDDAWAELARERPALAPYAARFAGPQVRAMGTLGGNLATASPIGDALPVLLVLDARIHLAALGRERVLPVAQFLTGYRTTALADDELIVAVEIPNPVDGEQVSAAKHSRRRDDDISAVSLATRLVVRDGVVTAARVAAGGVAEMAARAPHTEAALVGHAWSRPTAAAAAEVLAAEFDPIDDVRAGGEHRRLVLATLLIDVWEGPAW